MEYHVTEMWCPPVGARPAQAAESDGSEAGAALMTFGKHRGRTFAEVCDHEPDYCAWAMAQPQPSGALAAFVKYLELQGLPGSPAVKRRRRAPARPLASPSAAPESCPAFWEPRQLGMEMGGLQVMHQANQQLSQHEMKPLVQSNHLANQWLNYQANQVKLEQPSQVKHQGIHQPSLGIAGTPHGYWPTSQPRWSPPAVPFASPMTQPLHVFPSKDASRQRSRKRSPDRFHDIRKWDLGIELWKYVARKNAASGRRRTFLGCFLQRAGRMSEERGGGSLTLLAFARLKDTSMLSRLELEAKLRNLMDMELDEGVRARAVEKVQRQLAELAEDDMGSGVPDDFLEESKAVTDGHVVFLDDAINKEGQATWAIDIQESVARGITANSIQNRYLDMLESLKLKAFLMNAEKESQVMDNEDMDVKLDNAPLRALMQQSVGDVMTPEDEAILLLLAEEAAARAAASRPLAEHVVNLTKQARIRQDDVKERRRRVALLRRWVEATWDDKTSDIEALVAKHAEELADVLELKPLERKRLLAVIEEGVSQEVPTETEESLLAEDAQVRYEHLRSLLESLRKELPPGMDVTNAEAEDIALFLGYLRAKSREALSPQ